MGDVIPFKKPELKNVTDEQKAIKLQKEINERCNGLKVPSFTLRNELLKVCTEALDRGEIVELPLVSIFGFESPIVLSGSIHQLIIKFSFTRGK